MQFPQTLLNWPQDLTTLSLVNNEKEIIIDFLKVLIPSNFKNECIFQPAEKNKPFRFSGKQWKLPIDMHILYNENETNIILSPKFVIGGGAERTVCKCYDLVTGKFYAEKPIYPSEKKILSHLKLNPKILGFYHTFHNPLPENGIPKSKLGIYVVEEYITENLFSALGNHLFTHTDTRLSLMHDILESLNEIHSIEFKTPVGKYNCAHNDIKPENILIKHNHDNSSFKAVMTDYSYSGICEWVPGTLCFQSPEYFELLKMMCRDQVTDDDVILFNQKYGLTKDIWATGLLFIDILKNKTTIQDDSQSFPALKSIVRAFPDIKDNGDESEIANAREQIKLDPDAIQNELQNIKKYFSHSKSLSAAMDLICKMLAYFPENRPTAKECLTQINEIIRSYNEEKS